LQQQRDQQLTHQLGHLEVSALDIEGIGSGHIHHESFYSSSTTCKISMRVRRHLVDASLAFEVRLFVTRQ